jgi:hypothetical protein
MNPPVVRLMVFGCWVMAIIVLVSASMSSALGVAAVWSIPAALAATLASVLWPGQNMARALALIGLAWQSALLASYWPFGNVAGASLSGLAHAGPMPLHALVIAAVLALLALAFLTMFVFPALGLLGRLGRMAVALRAGPAAEHEMAEIVAGDVTLDRAWREYAGHLRLTQSSARISTAPARHFINMVACGEARLRVEFFRHLPGIFTGIGIIGTFSGLILGLRAFRVSDEISVVQNSLNGLLQGVWESFLISAVAISLAIVATVVEKILLAMLARRFETVSQLADAAFPPQATETAADGVSQAALDSVEALLKKLPAAILSVSEAVQARPVAAPVAPEGAAVIPIASAAAAAPAAAINNSEAVEALRGLTDRLDLYFNDHLKASALAQQQATQVLKNMSNRLEVVASAIESSGRKTVEVVASRLMDAQLHMSARQQATAEQIAELLGRIEALCGLIQRDQASGGDAMYRYGNSASPDPGRSSFGGGMGGVGGMGGNGNGGRSPRDAYPESSPADWYSGEQDRGGSPFGDDPFADPRPGLTRFGS